MKILIVIGNGGGEIYDLFTKAQRETWQVNKHGSVDVVYHSGDDYYNVAQREVKVIENNPDYDYYFMTTASAYIDTRLLFELCQSLPDTGVYAGKPLGDGLPDIEWLGQTIKQAIVSGAGIIYSNDVAKMLKKLPDIRIENDVLIGRYLRTKGINYIAINDRIDNNIFMKSWHYRFHTNNRRKDIKQMYKLHANRTRNTHVQ